MQSGTGEAPNSSTPTGLEKYFNKPTTSDFDQISANSSLAIATVEVVSDQPQGQQLSSVGDAPNLKQSVGQNQLTVIMAEPPSVTSNTSVDIDTAVATFQQMSLSSGNQPTHPEVSPAPVGLTAVSQTLNVVPTKIQSSPAANADKLKQYFNSQPIGSNPFESLTNLASNTEANRSGSAMMNPVYMSPTEGAGFGFTAAIPSPDSFLTPATEQDVFTASLLSSDADRRHDAWIPSAATKKALKAVESNPPGIYFPEKELLTMPGIAIKEDFVSDY